MKRALIILALLTVGLIACSQTGTGWYQERRKTNFKDSTSFAKSPNFLVPYRINGTAVTSNAQELNILDGGLITYTELNNLLNSTSNIQTQLNAKQATLVSGTSLKTVNGESLLGSGNIVIGSTGGSMVYPGAGIPISSGTAWGTSITNNSAQWDTAYVARLRWDGGSTNLVPATGRTSLGGTTVGQNMFTLTNPDAIRFLRINADNTVTSLSAANFKTALSLTATDVSLGNVTNESKTTMFTSPTFTTRVTLAAQTYVPSGGTINFNTSGGYLAYNASSDDLYIGDMGVQLLTGSLGKELAPVSKGWFTDLDVTNAIAGSITGNAATVTGFTRNSGSLTLSGGHGLTITTTGTTSVTLPTSGTLTTNPMTTAGDIIIGGTAGAPTRLAATTNGYVLTLSAGAPVWAAAAGGEAVESRIDSIVAVLKDTMNIEELLLFDVDTDTLATRDYVRTFTSAERLPFIIGTTAGAPTTVDSTVVHAAISGNTIDLYRDGAKQYQNFTTTNTVEGFRVSNDTIYVKPLWQQGEQIIIEIKASAAWTYLEF